MISTNYFIGACICNNKTPFYGVGYLVIGWDEPVMDAQWLADCNQAIDIQLKHPENWNKFNSGGIAVDAAPNEILEDDNTFVPPAELLEPVGICILFA